MSILLQAKQISKSFNSQIVLNEASFTISEKQKLGVIGINGAGKSTLFKIITGEEKSDDGEVIIFDDTRLGYLKQEEDLSKDDIVLDYLVKKSKKEEWQCAKMAAQFELGHDLLNNKLESLSGGYQMRVKLIIMLLQEPNLLLLDEPTNYLDLSTILLLEKFLKNYKGAYLVISHDRRFLNNVCKEILEIDRGKAYYYPNNLENYLLFKKEKLAADKKFNKKQEARRKHLQKFIDRFGVKASKASQAKQKEKQIAKLKTIEIKNSLRTVSIRVPQANEMKGLALRTNNLSIGYDDKEVAKEIDLDIDRGEHLAVLGDNGQGKSTFLKTVAKELEQLSGSFRWHKKLKIAYFSQHVTTKLNPKETVESFLDRSAGQNHTNEDILKMAGDFLFSVDDIKKPISVLSGGEKARLCLAGMLLQSNDVFLLDEPTNHLDFETAEALAVALMESNATIFFISHDRTFTNLLADNILEVKDKSIKRVFGTYDDYIEALQEKFAREEDNSSEEEIDKVKEEKKKKYEENKEIKKELVRLDKQVEKLKKEKQRILDKFTKDPTKPRPEALVRLKIIDQEINEVEEEWFSVSERSYKN